MASNSSSECGYYCKFVTEPSDALTCLICHGVARNPKQHETCGKLFCQGCIEQHLATVSSSCPACRETHPKYFSDSRSKREILDLAVYCDNEKRSCKWQGTVATLTDHIGECQYAMVPCPKMCEDKGILRKDLSRHLKDHCPNRPYKCEYCERNGTYASTLKHYQICPKKVLSCSNDECTAKIERRNLKRHIDGDCDFTILPCKYQRIGCDIRLQRKDLSEHESDDKTHLRQALDAVVELEKKLDNTVACLKNENAFSFKMTNYEWRMVNKTCFQSPKFLSHRDGGRMMVVIAASGHAEFSGTHLSLWVCNSSVERDSVMYLTGSVTVILLNQLADDNHHVVKADFVADSNNYIASKDVILLKTLPMFISNAKLTHDAVKKTQYLKNDSLFFRVSVQTSDYKPWLKV